MSGNPSTGIVTGYHRHCCFCLLSIPAKNVQKCSKCNQRVYCGKNCQRKDWKSKKEQKNSSVEPNRQGHKDWCGVPVLEEGVDWKVKKSSLGSLEVFAKRDIPKGTRVLVDGTATPGHGLVFAMQDKLIYPNAEAVIDKNDLQVTIVTTSRNVRNGERITFKDFGIEASVAAMFPNGNPTKQEIVRRIEKAQDFLKGLEIIGRPRFVMASVLREQFLCGLFLKKETFPQALEKGRESLEIFSSIYHPNGKLVKQLKAFLQQAEYIHTQLKEGNLDIIQICKTVETLYNMAEEVRKSKIQNAICVVPIYG